MCRRQKKQRATNETRKEGLKSLSVTSLSFCTSFPLRWQKCFLTLPHNVLHSPSIYIFQVDLSPALMFALQKLKLPALGREMASRSYIYWPSFLMCLPVLYLTSHIRPNLTLPGLPLPYLLTATKKWVEVGTSWCIHGDEVICEQPNYQSFSPNTKVVYTCR